MDVKTIGSGNEKDFYPTPKELAEVMLENVDWDYVETVLEPSAGKGDLVDVINEESVKGCYKGTYYPRKEKDIDCVEIDENLQHILRGKGYKVVHDDFLTFNTFKHYDLIIMNPPFSDADKHLRQLPTT